MVGGDAYGTVAARAAHLGLRARRLAAVERLHRELDQELVGRVDGAGRRAFDALPLFGKDADVLVQGAVG